MRTVYSCSIETIAPFQTHFYRHRLTYHIDVPITYFLLRFAWAKLIQYVTLDTCHEVCVYWKCHFMRFGRRRSAWKKVTFSNLPCRAQKKMRNLSFRRGKRKQTWLQHGKRPEDETWIEFPWRENRSRQVHTILASFHNCAFHIESVCFFYEHVAGSGYFSLRGGSYQYPVCMWFSSKFILNAFAFFLLFFVPFIQAEWFSFEPSKSSLSQTQCVGSCGIITGVGFCFDFHPFNMDLI